MKKFYLQEPQEEKKAPKFPKTTKAKAQPSRNNYEDDIPIQIKTGGGFGGGNKVKNWDDMQVGGGKSNFDDLPVGGGNNNFEDE